MIVQSFTHPMLGWLVLSAVSGARADCSVAQSATWTYLPPTAFDHSVTKQGLPRGWTNFKCAYEWHVHSKEISFQSPSGCLTDDWVFARGTTMQPSARINITYVSAAGSPVRSVAGDISSNCSLIDMDDGGLYLRGTHPIDQSDGEWMRTVTAWLIRAAQVTFRDGSRHLTPGYPTQYNGQWMRDGYYGIAHGWDLASAMHHEQFLQSFEWLLGRARPDGIMPQQCPPEGPCSYGNEVCNDTVGAPGWHGCQDLDTASFAIQLASTFWTRLPAARARALYTRWRRPLLRSLDATVVSPDGSGLLWSDPRQPIIGYGFQDAEIKSGAVLYSTVLAWNATRLLAAMAHTAGDESTAQALRDRAAQLKGAADRQLWDASLGVFRASTEVGHTNVDVWANAAAGATGFADAAQAKSIYAYFAANEQDIFYEGQVREIPQPQQWAEARFVSGCHEDCANASAVAKASARVYQNGGYWATPHHHVLPFLALYDRPMACRLLAATIASFRGHGIWEWVGPFYPAKSFGAPNYVASAANTYFASLTLRC